MLRLDTEKALKKREKRDVRVVKGNNNAWLHHD